MTGDEKALYLYMVILSLLVFALVCIKHQRLPSLFELALALVVVPALSVMAYVYFHR